jgi:hypothetical protein
MKIIATIAPPGRKGDILREYVDIPSRKDIAKVRSWLSGAVFASPESRAAIPGQIPRVRKQKGPRPWRGRNNILPINSNVYRIYISFLSDFQSPWSRFPPTDKEGTASIHGDLPSAVSHANSARQVAVGAAAPQLCLFLAANLGACWSTKVTRCEELLFFGCAACAGPLFQSSGVYDVRLRVGTTLCHLMT